MSKVKTTMENKALSHSSVNAASPDEALVSGHAEEPCASLDCSYLSPAWNVVEKIADYIHAVGRINSSSGSAILIGYSLRYDYDANECEFEEEQQETDHESEELYKQRIGNQEVANREDFNNNEDVKESSGNKKNSRKSKTRLMGVLLTTSSVLFPEDYANVIPTNPKNVVDTPIEETITFLEEPVAGTAARLGFTTTPISVRLRTDCGLITSLTDDELLREERRRRDQYNHINEKNKYWSEEHLPSSTVLSNDSVVSSNEQTPSSQLSPLFDLTKSNNEVDGQLNSANLNSFVSSHLYKTCSNGHISNSDKHQTIDIDKEKDHPLVILNAECPQTHVSENVNNGENANTNWGNEFNSDDEEKKSTRKEEQSSTTAYTISSDDVAKNNKSSTCEMSEDRNLTSTSEYDNKDNKDLVANYNNNNNANDLNSSNASHVLHTTHNTALPLNSTTRLHASINIKANFTSSYHYNNHNHDPCNNDFTDSNAEDVIEDDATSGEIVGYCLTYCDLTPAAFAQLTDKNSTDNYCNSENTDILNEEQVCSAITPLPLPLLLSKLKPVQVGDVHMIITHVDYNKRNKDIYKNNRNTDSIHGLHESECLRNKQTQENVTSTATTTTSSPPPLKGKVTRRHKLFKVCFVSEHYCEYELTCSTDHLHWCSGGAVFDMNGSFIGLHHQEVEGRCMCLFTSSIVRHLFENNLLGLCISPISSLTRMQVANGEVQSSSSSSSSSSEEYEQNDENDSNSSARFNNYATEKCKYRMKQQDKELKEHSESERKERLVRQCRRRLFSANNNRKEHENKNKSENSNINNPNNAEISLNDAFMMCSNNGKQLVDFTTFQRMRAHHRCVTSALPPSFEEVYDEFYEAFHSLPHLLYAFPYCSPLVIKVLDELVKPIHNTEANMEYIALSGGVGVILELMDAYPRHTALLTSALIALAKLSVHDRCLNIFTQLDGIITLLALLRDHNEPRRYQSKRTFQFTQWAVFCLLKACSSHAAHVESSKALVASQSNLEILCTLLATCTQHISPRVEQMLTWLCALLHELTDCDSTVCMSLINLNIFSYLQLLLTYCHANMKYISEVLLLNVLALLDVLAQRLLHIPIKQTEENVKIDCSTVKQQQKIKRFNFIGGNDEIDVKKIENCWSVAITSHIIAIADKYSQTKYTTYKEQILTHCISLLSALCTADHAELTLEAINQIQAICARCISSSSLTMYSHVNVLAQELQSKLVAHKSM